MEKQTITRDDLKILYTLNICDKWKRQIEAHIKDQVWNETIEVEERLILEAYKEADQTQKQALSKYFKINIPKSITEKIKSWEDVLIISGQNEEDILHWKNPSTKKKKSQNAVAKLQLISEVLNEGKAFETYYWFPWWEKSSGGGFRFRGSYSDYSLFGVPSGFYFVNKELSDFAANTFKDIYIDYLPSL